jgi:hypothetical protein
MTQVKAPPGPPTAAAAPGQGRGSDALAWLAVAALPIVVVSLYFTRYPSEGLNARLSGGWDIFAYVWQTRAVGHTSVSFIGTRPGTPALISLLRSVVPLDPMQQLVVIPPMLVVALALASAAVVRMALRLPTWTVPVVAFVVSLFPTTSQFVVGYQANLLMLTVAAAGVAFMIEAPGRRRALAVAAVLFIAAAFTHIVVYANLVVVAGVAVLLAIPAFLRDRRQGLPLLSTEAGTTVGAMAPGVIIGAGTIFGALGLSPSDALHAEAVVAHFKSNTVDEVHFIRPRITLPIALVGMGTAWATGSSRAAVALRRLGFAWLAVCAVGTAAPYFGFDVPGARFILFALPLPVLIGLGLAGVGLAVLRRPARWRWALAAVLVLGGMTGLAAPRVRAMYGSVKIKPAREAVWRQLDAAAAYVGRLPANRSVVFVADQPGQYGAATPKRTTYQARSAVPVDAIDRTFVYMGTTENLVGRRPTFIADPQYPWQRSYNSLSRQLWEEAEPVLRGGAAVLVLEGFAAPDFEALRQRGDPEREVAPGVYVLQGPVIPIRAESGFESLGSPLGTAAAVAYLILLGLLGWGVTAWGLRGADATLLDRLCLAPAVGAGIGVLAGFALALGQIDPAGVIGIVVLAALAAGGLYLRRRADAATAPQD